MVLYHDPIFTREPDRDLTRPGGLYTLCGEINAKNSLGGYVGYEPFYSAVYLNPENLHPIDTPNWAAIDSDEIVQGAL